LTAVAPGAGRRYIQGIEDKSYHIVPDAQGGFSVQTSFGPGEGVSFKHGFKSDAEACEWIRAQGDESPRIVRK
jgi:hypothetical protein